MMRRLILAALLVMAGQASAQTAKVTSGEHDGFSRLVVELPAPGDWQFGRTADGYALSISAPPAAYDLTGVFKLIRRDRLAAIAVDASTGDLQIGLACPCYAIPFEFRPGIIVIDIRDGAPPDGSSFEQPLTPEPRSAGATTPQPSQASGLTAPVAPKDVPVVAENAERGARVLTPRPDPAARWVFSAPPKTGDAVRTAGEAVLAPNGSALDAAIRAAAEPEAAPEVPAAPGPAATPAPMTALRDDLLMQISRGAARGVLDLAASTPRLRDRPAAVPASPFPQVAVDRFPGLTSSTVDDPGAALTADGAACIADSRLSIAEWGRDGPVAGQIAALNTGLVQEFDAVDPVALGASVRYALYLGFGVEAGRLIEVFPTPELGADAPVWSSMGRIIDGYSDQAGAFAAMQSCDTAAALWSVLATDRLTAAGKINTKAVLRSFSALPLHLRLALGPTLATRFLGIDRQDVAQAIRAAIARAPAGAGREADLIGARLELAKGDAQGAETLAQGVIAGAGPGVAEAMLALVNATLAQGRPVEAATADALAAILRENKGAPLELDLTSALILALASGGNADAAFRRLPDHPQSEPALWAALARSGTDNDILKHAVRTAETMPAGVAPDIRTRIADRLQGLGFPEQAATWRAVAAGEETGQVAATALPTSDADAAAATERARILAHDWAGLARDGSNPWKGAARRAAVESPGAAGLPPLAAASALLKNAAETRADITALLARVAQP